MQKFVFFLGIAAVLLSCGFGCLLSRQYDQSKRQADIERRVQTIELLELVKHVQQNAEESLLLAATAQAQRDNDWEQMTEQQKKDRVKRYADEIREKSLRSLEK